MSHNPLFHFRQKLSGRDTVKTGEGLKRFGKDALDKGLDSESLFHCC